MRDPTNGELIHDDLVISAALGSLLDAQPWGVSLNEVTPASDPLFTLTDPF